MTSTLSHLLPSSVLKWSIDDVCRWFTSLSLNNDYSTKLRELLIDGQVLAYSDCNSLINSIGILTSSDKKTFALSHKKLSKSVPPFHPVPFQNHQPVSFPNHQSVPFQSPPTSSPSSATSFSTGSLTSPTSVSPIKSTSPESFRFPSMQRVSNDDNEQQGKFKLCLKSKSLDELLNTVGYRDTILTTPTNQSSHLFDMLRSENVLLKKELEYYYERVSRLQKLDLELQQLQDSYRLLEGTSQRKAKLEKSMRERIEEELLRMKVAQTHLKDELFSIKRASTNKHYIQNTSSLKERELTIEKLSQENEQAIALRRKLENSLRFTKSSLEQNNFKEKRKSEPMVSHNDGNMKTSALDYNDEKKRSNDVVEVHIKNIEVLQSLLISMQVSSDNRQRLEQQLRKQLEDKVKELEAGQSIGSNNKGKTKNDQQILIATLQADLAQMEQKYAELLAEKQLSMDNTRQSQLSLLEDNKIEQEEELKTVKLQRDRYMKQLEQANHKIMEQEKRIHVLESLQSRTTNGCYSAMPIYTPTTMPTNTTAYPHHSSYQRAPPILTTPLSLPTLTTPTPTLPSYDEHVRYYTSPTKHHQGDHTPPIGLSRSFPNTPETIRRRINPNPVPIMDSNNFLCSSSPAGSLKSAMSASRINQQQYHTIQKSLTPPPLNQRPSLLTNNGHTPLMTIHTESLDRSLSPNNFSRHLIGRNCHSFGSSLTYDAHN